MIHVLLVSDDASQGGALRAFLTRHEIDLSLVSNADALSRNIDRAHPTVVLLDLTMPLVDVLTALKTLRANAAACPIIMLTASDADMERVVSLGLGADDYFGKQSGPEELLARIHAVLRRHDGHALPGMPGLAVADHHLPPFHFGPFTVDFGTRTLFRDHTPIRLTSGEYALLAVFTQHPMQALSRARLIEMLHGPNSSVTERGIDVPVWRLRRLLEENPAVPRRIQTLRSIGYMFVPDGEYFF